jgi:hypothetical protein
LLTPSATKVKIDWHRPYAACRERPQSSTLGATTIEIVLGPEWDDELPARLKAGDRGDGRGAF